MIDALEHAYTFIIRGTIYGGSTALNAVMMYNDLRDVSGEGQSTWPPRTALYKEGKLVGWFSYNGRIWERREYAEGDRALKVEDL